MYQAEPGTLASIPLMPEWYLVVLALALLAGVGVLSTALRPASLLFVAAASLSVCQAGRAARRARFPSDSVNGPGWPRLMIVTAVLHLMQPAARLLGRLRHGLTPWRRRGAMPFQVPLPRLARIWSEKWLAPEDLLSSVERVLRSTGRGARRGSAWDRWDLEVPAGLLGIRPCADGRGGARRWPAADALQDMAAMVGNGHRSADLAHRAGVAWPPPGRSGPPPRCWSRGGSLLLAGALYESGIALGRILQAVASQKRMGEHE